MVAAAVGVLRSGAVGRRYALRKFKQERTFDERLRWHIEASKAFFDASRKLAGVVRISTRLHHPTHVVTSWLQTADEAIGVANRSLVGLDFYADVLLVEQIDAIEQRRLACLARYLDVQTSGLTA